LRFEFESPAETPGFFILFIFPDHGCDIVAHVLGAALTKSCGNSP
jgi:hypothetical protein